MKKRLTVLAAVLVVATLAGCSDKPKVKVDTPNYSKPLEPGRWALRKITDPAEIPDFTPALGDVTGLRSALANSLNYLSKPTSRRWYTQGYGGITHEQVIASLKAFDDLLASGQSPVEINAAVRRDFDVYTSLGWNGQGGVLFTGYYTPIFRGSRTRTEEFTYALYKMPADLVKADDGTIVGRKGPDGRIISQYPSRDEIETSGMLVGTELAWLSDPFEVYICHVQGSASLRLGDGEMMSVGYTANNGHEYRSVG
ncbi:MAG: MltA domain-containing protein, partial [Phycisphaerae bacterium]|nr:MltA domain-containing protein [Phycisphaerae bacterium]